VINLELISKGLAFEMRMYITFNKKVKIEDPKYSHFNNLFIFLKTNNRDKCKN